MYWAAQNIQENNLISEDEDKAFKNLVKKAQIFLTNS